MIRDLCFIKQQKHMVYSNQYTTFPPRRRLTPSQASRTKMVVLKSLLAGKVREVTLQSSERYRTCEQSPLTYFSLVFVRFRTVECITTRLRFLLMMWQLVKKVPLENKSSISLGGTIVLLALFAHNFIFRQIKNSLSG